MRKSAVATKMPGDFAAVFDQLKQLVRQKSAGTKLAVITDEPGNYCLTAGYS